MTKTKSSKLALLFTPAVIVASLGYFVDIFDLLLFSIVRRPSLAALGLDEASQITTGLFLHNLQMIGMLIGGVLWGVMGDKRGRLSVLFGSIFLYSTANIANAFVTNVPLYAVLRFLAGVGLAGELGAGITLVSETLPKELRGYGTMIVATVGVSGAVVAGLVSEYFDWRTTYLIGGVLGLALFVLRINTAESLLFKNIDTSTHKKGDFFSIFKSRERGFRFLNCILIGVPIWFVIGTLIQLGPELAAAMGVLSPVTAGRTIMFCYTGLVFGDFASGGLSQIFKTRMRIVQVFLVLLFITEVVYFNVNHSATASVFYATCFALGFFAGYWAVFVTVAAEQFGTNMRATVATSVPNFVRASVVPMSLAFTFLEPGHGILNAAMSVGFTALAIAFVSSFFLKDSFGRDMNFLEVD